MAGPGGVLCCRMLLLSSVAVAIPLVTACEEGRVVLLEPEGSGAERTVLTVKVRVDPANTDLAGSLGWARGVPRAQVSIHEQETSLEWELAVTDSTGTAEFPRLLPGRYDVAAFRVLSDEETQHTAGVVRAFGGGSSVRSSGAEEMQLVVMADRAASLVISEVGLITPLPWEVGGNSYFDAKYLEIFNNADTTIYLDQKILGIGYDLKRDYPFWPCTTTEPLRNDPDGIWSRHFFAFPGRGRSHPIRPGEAKVIAKIAADHRKVHAGLPDLSGADFELTREGAGDNPSVPNLVDVGLAEPLPNRPNHEDPLFLAEWVNVEVLPRRIGPEGRQWVRFPRDKLLDATTFWHNFTQSNYEAAARCGHALHPNFERLGATLLGAFDLRFSEQRKVLRLAAAGRKVLQDTNTGAVDFHKAQRTPGWIP